MDDGFRKRLLAGDLLLGTMITLASPEVAEILALAGFDWLFVDAEHSPLDPLTAQRILQGAGRETPCLVRLPSREEAGIKKALDAGAAGIIVPMVNSADQAAEVIRMARYAPQGARGVGVGRATGYGHDLAAHLAGANAETAVVLQAEHIQAVENIETIIQVPGIDAIFVGPYDLSASMGKIGQVADPDVLAAITHVTEACRQAGIPLGIFGASAEAVRPYIARGFTLIVAGVDTLMLGGQARAILAALR